MLYLIIHLTYHFGQLKINFHCGFVCVWQMDYCAALF